MSHTGGPAPGRTTIQKPLRDVSRGEIARWRSLIAGLVCAVGLVAGGASVASAASHFAYVGNFGSGNVSAFPIAAGGGLSAVSGSPFTVGTEPFELAVSPDGRHLYVTNEGSGNVSAFSIAADGSLAPVSGSPFTAGTQPVGVAVSPDGAHLYVANLDSNSVSGFSIAANGSLTPVSGSPFTAGTNPVEVAVSPDGAHVYVTNEVSGNVSAFSIAANGSLTPVSGAPFTAGNNPVGVAVSPDGAHLYVANLGSNSVSGFSIAADGSLTAVPGSPFSANGRLPVGVVVSPDGAHLYLTNAGSKNVAAYSIVADGHLTSVNGSPYSAGSNPEGVAITPDQAPVAAFSASAAPAGSASVFDGSASHDSDGTVVRYDWSFGDGSVALNAGARPAHTYTAPGTYTVMLTVADDAGCSTRQTFTGQTVSCNGGTQAIVSRRLRISKLSPPPHSPDRVKITNATISAKHHTARFTFRAMGSDAGFQCALFKQPRDTHHRGAKPHFSSCKSPTTYRHLKSGKYTFEVRAVNATRHGDPAGKSFRLA